MMSSMESFFLPYEPYISEHCAMNYANINTNTKQLQTSGITTLLVLAHIDLHNDLAQSLVSNSPYNHMTIPSHHTPQTHGDY